MPGLPIPNWPDAVPKYYAIIHTQLSQEEHGGQMRSTRISTSLIIALFVLYGFGQAVPVARGQSLAAPAPAGQTQATVLVPMLNVRAGPGIGYAIVDHAAGGTVLPVQSQSPAGDWLQVQTPNVVGWIASSLVELSAAQPAAPDGSPTRIVAPTIGLDSRVVPTGWHETQTADGSVSSDWDVPAYAAGWLISSVRPADQGNVVLSGHHNIYGKVFRYVVNLNVGDPITLYAGNQAYQYQVTDKFILPDKYVPDAQRVQNARWIGSFSDSRLTLVTCWPYTNNTHRVIVIAHPAAGQ
jgi:LPXTG-site transpeptidase (sortase) family protein